MTAIHQIRISPDPTVSWVDVTPALAAEWLSRNVGNRNQRPRALAAYARDMKSGHWLQTGDAIRFDTNGKMIDGQHRCEAIVETGVTCRMLVIEGLDPRVRDVLDTNVRRSAPDALLFNGFQAHRTILASMARLDAGLQHGDVRSTASSMPAITNSEVVAWVLEHPEAVDAAAWGSRIHGDIYATPSVVGYAVWRTVAIDPEVASDFWNSMSNLQTGGPGDPRHAAIRKLKNYSDTGVRPLPARQLFILFRAWNAFRDGEALGKIVTETRQGGTLVPEPK